MSFKSIECAPRVNWVFIEADKSIALAVNFLKEQGINEIIFLDRREQRLEDILLRLCRQKGSRCFGEVARKFYDACVKISSAGNVSLREAECFARNLLFEVNNILGVMLF